ncbi:MAG: exodeoxyribonuclease VII large subunit [Magnetococcales bacterium]|nr:exodeoxyribonuclease VII large subunit [Magnetococcales bacterium]
MTGPSHCLTVSQLNDEIRELLEDEFPYIQVRGEIADWKIPPSGHIYFSLADSQSRIRAVIWRATRTRIPTLPNSGDAVVVTGRIAVYSPRGEYQLVVEGLRPDGAGGEREKLIALHKKLAAEGLFDQARKRPIPFLPATVGVVTSASGAVIHDITRVLDRRFPGYHLLLAHARVQGEGAAEEIAAALSRLIQDGRAEVILCGRGGGASDDLAAFNSEIVVRAIAASPIPILSAVGHEIDTTLADLAADARASTPSAAAELAMPEQLALMERLDGNQTRLIRAISNKLRSKQERLAALRLRLIHPRRRIEQSRQRCDELEQRLIQAIHALLQRQKMAQHHLLVRLGTYGQSHPLAIRAARIGFLQVALSRAMQNLLQRQNERHRLLQARLIAISPLQVLTRGYALIQDKQGILLRSSQQVQPGATCRVILAEGELTVLVTEIKQPA